MQEADPRTGYTPNVAARSLVSGRSGVIGLVVPSRVRGIFEDPFFSRLIQGVSAAAAISSGDTLSRFLFQTEEEESELYPRVVSSGFLDGLIVTATRMADPLMARMAAREVPVVVVGRPDVEGVSYINVDNRGGAFQAAIHLCNLGYQRIGLVARRCRQPPDWIGSMALSRASPFAGECCTPACGQMAISASERICGRCWS